MHYPSLIMSIVALSLMPFLGACERTQDQMTPAATKQEGNQKAEQYPSTRNSENPDPSIGGMNSATSRQDPNAPGSSATHPSGTGGTGNVSGR
jgi:hypothetical protein